MIQSINETILCDDCAHKEVCMYKGEFAECQRAISEVTVSLPHGNNGNYTRKISDIPWIRPVVLGCNNYRKDVGVR